MSAEQTHLDSRAERRRVLLEERRAQQKLEHTPEFQARQRRNLRAVRRHGIRKHAKERTK